MSRQFRNHYTQNNLSSMRYFFRGSWRLEEYRMEQQRKFDQMAAKNTPRRPKIQDYSDKYVFLGSTIGLLLGAVATGVIGAILHWNIITIFFAVLGGVVVGGLIGAFAVQLIILINKKMKKHEAKKQAADDQTHA
jgi:hypothetical protein